MYRQGCTVVYSTGYLCHITRVLHHQWSSWRPTVIGDTQHSTTADTWTLSNSFVILWCKYFYQWTIILSSSHSERVWLHKTNFVLKFIQISLRKGLIWEFTFPQLVEYFCVCRFYLKYEIDIWNWSGIDHDHVSGLKWWAFTILPLNLASLFNSPF